MEEAWVWGSRLTTRADSFQILGSNQFAYLTHIISHTSSSYVSNTCSHLCLRLHFLWVWVEGKTFSVLALITVWISGISWWFVWVQLHNCRQTLPPSPVLSWQMPEGSGTGPWATKAERENGKGCRKKNEKDNKCDIPFSRSINGNMSYSFLWIVGHQGEYLSIKEITVPLGFIPVLKVSFQVWLWGTSAKIEGRV